jgi:hypothetical protein
MTEFPKCLLVVTAEVDPEVEAEWNRWYDAVHVPDVLACPGVRGGRRYVSAGDVSESVRGQTERSRRRIYTTIYELDSEVTTSAQFLAARLAQFAPHVRSRTVAVLPTS